MKKSFSIIFIIFFNIWFSFWIFSSTEDQKKGDCKNISTFEKNSIKQLVLSWNKIIDEKVYNQALINLKKHCDRQTNVLETNIFTNHLMDVAFRKLDAIKGLSYGIKPDNQWKAWREYLNDIENIYQTPPKNIYYKFIEFRWTPKKNTWANMKTLYGKYKQVCEEIYQKYQILTNKYTYDNKKITPKIFLSNCNKITELRYNNEANLVEQIMFQNYYKIVNDTLFKGFNQIYWKEFWDLYDKFMVALWNYEYMVRRFIKVTDANTK